MQNLVSIVPCSERWTSYKIAFLLQLVDVWMYLGFLLSVTGLEVLQIELVELLLHFRRCWLLYRCHVQSSVLLDLVNHEDSWLDYLAFFSALDFWSLIVCCFSYQAVCQACVFCFLASQLIHTFDLLFSYILVIIRGNLSLL